MVVDPDYLSRVSSSKNKNSSNDADAAKLRRTSVPVVFSESKETVTSARGMQARNSLPSTKQSKRLKRKQFTKKHEKTRSMFSMLMSVLRPSKKRLVCMCVCVCTCLCVYVCVCMLFVLHMCVCVSIYMCV